MYKVMRALSTLFSAVSSSTILIVNVEVVHYVVGLKNKQTRRTKKQANNNNSDK